MSPYSHEQPFPCSLCADNAVFYGANKVPFVMGTTGGDREKLLADTEASGTYAVIAPQMGKQVTPFLSSLRTVCSNRSTNFNVKV